MIRTAGISAALRGVMDDQGRKAVGDRLDVPKSTLGDWGTEINSWPGDKLLEAGHAYPEAAPPSSTPGPAMRLSAGPRT